MKNILFIMSFIFIGCNAQQQIIPLETKGYPLEGSYYKDLNNDLDPFIGTWVGTFNNQTFIITFSKYKDYNSMGNYYKDRLAGKYKMLDINTNQSYSTYNLSDNNAKVLSLGFVENTNKTKLRLMFSDLCINGEIHISFENPQQTQLHYKYFTKQTLITNETGCAPYNEMPRGEITLVKQ